MGIRYKKDRYSSTNLEYINLDIVLGEKVLEFHQILENCRNIVIRDLHMSFKQHNHWRIRALAGKIVAGRV